MDNSKQVMKINTGIRILLIFIFIFLNTILSYAGTVVVKPGKFDHFVLQVPEKIMAGENAVIKIMVYDAHDNIITNFSESGREFRIGVTGTAIAQPAKLSPNSFPGGVANVSFTDKRAESVVFSIYEEGGTVPILTREIMVSPNKLDHFVIQTPPNAVAGQSFDVRIIAEDAFGNPVEDREMVGKSLRITSRGSATLRIADTFVPDFKKGAVAVSLVSEKSGDALIEVHETVTGSKGLSKSISIVPAELSYFRVSAPKEVVAGEPFELTVSAYDAFGNPINNYASTGNGIVLLSTGTSRIEPSFVQASSFKSHEANLRITYDKAEEISIIVKENNKRQEGRSGSVKVNPASVDHFVIITPDSAVAGQPFKLKVTAYDRFGNIIRNYNLTGAEVILTPSGKGNITPSIISPAEFRDGVAVVEVVYDKAESFSISASTLKRERLEKTKTEGIKPPVEERPLTEIKKEVAVETKKESLPVKEVKDATETEERKTPVESVMKEEVAKISRETKGPKEPKEPKIARPKQTKETDSGVASINNVAIIESRDKAMLVISASNLESISLREDVVSRREGQWLELRINPAVINTNRNFKFKSRFIGDVILEEDRTIQNGTILRLQLLPQKVLFDVAKVKNSIVVTVSNP